MKKLILLLAVVATVASCKKDEAPTRSQLIAGTWRPSFEAEDVNTNKTLEAGERVAITDPLVLSLTYLFNADGTGVFRDPRGAQAFTWMLYDNDQRLILTDPSSAEGDTLKLHTLTGSELIIEATEGANEEYRWFGLKK